MSLVTQWPHNLEAERAVLGAMMLSGEAADAAVDILGADSAVFYDSRHRKVYEAMLTTYQARAAVDVVTVQSELRRCGLAKEIEPTFLTDLQAAVPTAANVKSYAKQILNKAIMRDYLTFAIDLVNGVNVSKDAEEDIATWEQRFFGISKRTEVKKFDLHYLFDSVLYGLCNRYEHNIESGYSWGIPRIDTHLLIRPKEMIVLAGLKKTGKSKFLVFTIYNLTLERVPVLFFSLEMSAGKVMRWLMSLVNHINSKLLASGKISRDDIEAIVENRNRIVEHNLTIDDRGGLSVSQIFSTARRWVAEHGPGGVIAIDFLQLVDMQRERGLNEATVIKNACFALANMAKELNVAIILLSQLRNEAENEKRPSLKFLEGSGGIAQAAEAIVILNNCKRVSRSQEDDRKVEFIIDAQRDGESSVIVPLYAELEYGDFTFLDEYAESRQGKSFVS